MRVFRIDDILESARKAGLVVTTSQVHQRRRSHAVKKGSLQLARLELLLHNFDAAETAIDNALRAKPNDKDAMYMKVMLNSPTMRNKPEEVIAAYRRLLTLPDASVRYWALVGMGREYLRTKKYAEARQVFQTGISEYGDIPSLISKVRYAKKEMASQKNGRRTVTIKLPKPTFKRTGASHETTLNHDPRRRFYALEDLYLGRKFSDNPSRNKAGFDRALKLFSADPHTLSDDQRRQLVVLHSVLDADAPTKVLEVKLNTGGALQEPNTIPEKREKAQLTRKDMARYPEIWRIVRRDIQGIRDALLDSGGTVVYLKKVYRKNIPMWRKAEELKWPEGALLMGLCYTEGLGVKKDNKRALALYRNAAEGGLGLGSVYMAHGYFLGAGVEKDINAAVSCWRRAAAEGSLSALNNLALCYANGTGVEADPSRAMVLYRRCANMGLTPAMFKLANLYEHGRRLRTGQAVSRNMSRAMYWYQRGIDKGDACSMHRLGRHMLSLLPQYWSKNEEGLSLVRKAERNGCPHVRGRVKGYEHRLAKKRAKLKKRWEARQKEKSSSAK